MSALHTAKSYGDTTQPAWIFIAEESKHILKTGVIEIRTTYIIGIEYSRQGSSTVGRAQSVGFVI